MPRFHILGSGAVGSLLTRYLRHYGYDVTLIMRSISNLELFRQANCKITFEKDGILDVIDRVSAEISQRKKERSIFYVDHRNEDQPIKALFVATKAHHVLEALEPLQTRLSQYSTIVLMQNGIGTYEEIIKCYFPDRSTRPSFIVAVNSHGVYRKPVEDGAYHIVQNGTGSFVFGVVPKDNWMEEGTTIIGKQGSNSSSPGNENGYGPMSNAHHLHPQEGWQVDSAETDPRSSLSLTLSALASMEKLNTKRLPWDTLYTRMLEKLVINACINPLTALMWCRNGDLIDKRQSYNIISRICMESSAVILQSGLLDHLRPALDSTEPLKARFHPDRLEKSAMDVCWGTSENRSSMLQDVARGDATEIDYINGYIVRLGKLAAVPTPVNETMVDMIKLKHRIRTSNWPSNRPREGTG